MSFHRSPGATGAVTDKLRQATSHKQVGPESGSIGSLARCNRSRLDGFAGNPHAISFALIAYASAWLKVHRMAEFYTGCSTISRWGSIRWPRFLQDAKRHGIRVLPVCVVRSGAIRQVESDSEISPWAR